MPITQYKKTHVSAKESSVSIISDYSDQTTSFILTGRQYYFALRIDYSLPSLGGGACGLWTLLRGPLNRSGRVAAPPTFLGDTGGKLESDFFRAAMMCYYRISTRI